ncbi:Selenide, water dikinase [Rhodobacteraceae bacterium THAF1]|uniref:selenide, water dikinase SelD n=1 Tax=Palleronia sp. THAF1 TaxID=2587842 RepID=UPI000F3AC56E|nr:selenide, water dikinase SelD [Palleronia sp. THAF1]QFU08119.1 Selenide, water dikinase [Palleronia sp. THAF1]VDC27986.1 Selenide, water dikinase [Rhodobacteraceae bacterium THAF1]
MNILPQTRDIVLIGGGHAHALVLRRWGMSPLAGARLTVVNPGPTAPYTGMLPGFVAGHYDRDTLEIDLVRLARFAGARLILGHATALDRGARSIDIEDTILGPRTIQFDAASIDIGIHSEMPGIPGFAEHATAAKPLGRFAQSWADYQKAGDRDAGIAVIGGGVGGCELAMAMSHGMGGADVTVIDSSAILSGLGSRARERMLKELERNRVSLMENAKVDRISESGVTLDDGRHIPARFVTGAAGARPHDWLTHTGLPLTDGFIDVGPTLQTGDPAIFAAGDCAHLTHAPRPKAGVFAVRQAPILHDNLRAAVSGGAMRRYNPQKDYLKLISTGRKSAVADKAGFAFHGAWLWRWKDRIDSKFMGKLSDLPAMKTPPLPTEHARGMGALTGQAPCGGCGAKVGRGVLQGALSNLPATTRADVDTGAGDDAAILTIGGTRQIITVDQLRAFTKDPALMARIAGLHALGDCLAMGADPQAMLPSLTLSRLSADLEERTLAEIMAGLSRVAEDAGAAIVGGHTATGAELQVGVTVTGLVDRAITLAGAQPGDKLVLTKPLGTGVVLAAEMALQATGPEVAACLSSMATPQFNVARDLRIAHAMTDVTGFGLAGHLMGICTASNVGAEILLDALPLLPGAERLLTAGVRSTLHDANAAIADVAAPDTPLAQILFDPQTAGGLLAALPADAETTHPVIGHLSDGPPRITAR